jgi:hypothetical protein
MRLFRKLPRALYPANSHEQACLLKAMSCLRADWGFSKSYDFDDLINQWKKFIKDVQEGYTLSLDEYTFRLSLRDELDEIVKTLPERLKSAINSFLEPLDGAYILATREVAEPLRPGEEGEILAMRWYRVPSVLLPDLEDSSWYGKA